MNDEKFSREIINELAVKYHSASIPEQRSIKERICSMLIQRYEHYSPKIKGFSKEDYMSEMFLLLYEANILDKFDSGNFVAYIDKTIENKFKKQLRRDSFIQSENSENSEDTDLGLIDYNINTTNKWKQTNPTKVNVGKVTKSNDDKEKNAHSNDVIHRKSTTHNGMAYSDIEITVEASEEIREFIIILLKAEFEKHLTKKQNNADRQLYTKLFFTEQVTDFCKILYNEDENYSVREVLMNRETLIFQSINIDFLDYIMEEICRCICEISDSEYKQNKFFGIKQSPEERICPKFDAKVYISFLSREMNKTVTDSAVTQQRRNYKELVRKMCY